MIEVESKVQISEKEIKEIRNEIRKIGKFEKKEEKIDDYYTLESLKSYPKKSLRIRKQGKGYTVNFKQSISYEKGVHAKKETEFHVDDINGFLALIRDFGFKMWLRKEKESEIYHVRENLHIEINHVKSLGWFLEIEALVKKKEEIKKSEKEIDKIRRLLGIHNKQIIKDGYTKQLWEKSH